MDYYEALKLFNIGNGKELNKENVKQIYRKLVKKWHPDVCGSDNKYKEIQEAYETINEHFKGMDEIKKSTHKDNREAIILDLKDLLEIFKGGSIRISEDTSIDKINIGRYNIFIKIELAVIINGKTLNSEFIRPRSIKDEYEVDLEIPGTELDKDIDIKVMILDKSIEKTMSEIRLNFRFNFSHISRVVVAIQRTDSK